MLPRASCFFEACETAVFLRVSRQPRSHNMPFFSPFILLRQSRFVCTYKDFLSYSRTLCKNVSRAIINFEKFSFFCVFQKLFKIFYHIFKETFDRRSCILCALSSYFPNNKFLSGLFIATS